VLQGARLDLIAMTPSLIDAELAGSTALAQALHVPPPDTWPPELYERDDLERMRALLQVPVHAGWAVYYLLERGTPPHLVGVAGFAGAPGADGVVDVGYSILPAYRRRGLATEAVGALLQYALARPGVRCVAAETYPSLEGSIGVLLKCGFQPVPARPGSETLRYECIRLVNAGAT
jgi:RimJ/RimL family protein N-acetyltransferase